MRKNYQYPIDPDEKLDYEGDIGGEGVEWDEDKEDS